MSNNDYNASVVIETATAYKGLTDLGQATDSAATTFKNLDAALKGSNTNLKDAAAALKSIVESQRQAAAATKDLAAARIAEAKATATEAKTTADAQAAADRHTLSLQREATAASQGAAAEARKANTVAQGVRATETATAASERRAAAERKAAASSLEVTDHLSNSRYLLYDVAATYGTISAGLLAIPAATAAVAIAYEKDFAQVIRTNDALWGNQEATDALRSSLKNLATEIPTSFSELSNIASIGGQLGIASDKMGQFTETVAKFGAASNVTTEEAATAFGRLENAFPKDAQAADFFNKIGSAVAYVGVKSVATESEIIAVVNQLSPLAAQAGFTAQEVVGLSGALASVRIRPELARGAFLSTMTKMTSAADQGATAFETYAKYLDMTGAAGAQLFKSDPGAFFTKFIQGIKGSIDSGNSFSSVMADLGVKEKRETQFLLALANGHEVLGSAMANSAEAYNKGTFLDDSTAGVFSTVSAELVKLGNAFKNLADSIGGSSLGVFGKFLEMLNGVVTGIGHLVDTVPAVGMVITGLLGFGAVVGVLLAFKAAQAAALAAVVAFRQVVGANIQQSISLSGVMKELSVTMLQARGATLAQAQAFVQANGMMAAYRTGVVSTNVATKQLQIGSATATTGIARMGAGVRGAGTALMGLAGGPIGIAITALALLGGAFFQAKADAESAAEAITTAMSAGADQGAQAIADRLNKIKVGMFANTDSRFTDLGKSMGELGDQAGVGMDKMVAAVVKGKGAGEELTKTLDEIAKRKGYMNFAEWDNSNSTVFDTQLSNLRDIQRAVIGLGNDTDKTGTAAKRSADAVKALGGAAAGATPAIDENGDSVGKTGDAADEATKKIQTYIDTLFGLINAEGATNASLEKLGAGLANSTSFDVGDSGGRDNLAALQETLRNAALYQQQLIDSGQQSAQQAQANYVAFVEGLYSQLASRGVDTTAIQGLADQTKHVFDSALSDENALNAQVKVSVNEASVADAKKYLDEVAATYGKTDVEFLATVSGGAEVVANVNAMQQVILDATGQPYVAGVDADVKPAEGQLGFIGDLAVAVTSRYYEMVAGADTSPATTALQGLAVYAQLVINNVIDGINSASSALSNVPGMGWAKNLNIGPVNLIPSAPAPAQAAAPKQAPSVPSLPTNPGSTAGTKKANQQAEQGLGSLGKGYDSVADKAAKAGGAGEKAGKDMANGIDDATKAVNDYANRLGQGLKSAFDKQYGLQTATDAYYTTLNSITKKRQDDLKSIQDLITKQKELNNARNSDLVDARKAGIEKNISIKYGETDRAADYANQEQTALDNAAAKQKDIQANKDNQKSLQDGMNALTGYSQAAIDNRAALRDLESKMLDMVVAYANTGKSQSQVDAYTRSLTSKFQQQVGQLGYNSRAVANLQGSMSRYVSVVRSVPARVNTSTTTSGTGSAAGALNGVRNAANGIPKNVNTRVHTDVSVTYLEVYDPYGTLKGLREIKNGRTQMGVQLAGGYTGGQIKGYASGGRVPGTSPSNPSVDNMLAKVDNKGLVKVRSNEWIIQEPAVKYYGNDFMENLNNMRLPKFAMGGQLGGGSSSGIGSDGGPVLVQLTAQNITDLLRAADRPVVLYTENTTIASSANKGNAILAATGAN